MKDEKILLIDSDDVFINITLHLLKKNNLSNVVVVKSGAEVLSKIRAQDFDMILTEIMISPIDGLEIIKEIRKIESYKNVPIIVLSAFASNGDEKMCISNGATDFLQKPIHNQKLIEKIKFWSNI